MKDKIARLVAQLGVRCQNFGYLLEHPAYGEIRKNGGSRDLFRLLSKPWLRRDQVRTILDVGANTGQFLRTARALFPNAFVFAFEPNPSAAQVLRSGFSRENVKVIETACGRKKETCELQLSHFDPA